MAAYVFYFYILSKARDDAQSSLGDVFFRPNFLLILFSSASRAHPSQEGLWWTEGSCGGENQRSANSGSRPKFGSRDLPFWVAK